MATKMTDQNVLCLREMYARDKREFSSVTLADIFGVDKKTVSRIINREFYRHLPANMLPQAYRLVRTASGNYWEESENGEGCFLRSEMFESARKQPKTP